MKIWRFGLQSLELPKIGGIGLGPMFRGGLGKCFKVDLGVLRCTRMGVQSPHLCSSDGAVWGSGQTLAATRGTPAA